MSYPGILQEINTAKIRHPSNQFRMNLDGIQELASSIKEHGLLQPIVVRPLQNEYEVVAGNRRLAAIKILKLRKIASHIIDLTEKEAYEVALVENIQHKTMNPIEEAVAFGRYVESHGWGGISELAKRIGRSQEFVTRRIQLLRLPERIQEEIMRQRITPSAALEMLPLDKGAIEEFADFVIKNPLTRNEIRHIVKVSKAKSDGNDSYNHMETTHVNSTNIAHEKELYLLDKALRKTLAVMKSTLLNFDDILDNVSDDWILKELLMQYRLIIHGDIDTFLKLRKRLKAKIPKGYFGLLLPNEYNDNSKSLKKIAVPDKIEKSAIHLWATKGLWQ
jgi:ParB family transcriptional regulator, chromosome partitioning protein